MGRERQCKIENPLMGGNPTTSMDRARRFVRKGLAEFTKEFTIRFFDNAARRRIAFDAEKRFHARLTGEGYDAVEENAWTARFGKKGGNELQWSFHASVFGHRAKRTEGRLSGLDFVRKPFSGVEPGKASAAGTWLPFPVISDMHVPQIPKQGREQGAAANGREKDPVAIAASRMKDPERE